MVLQRYFHGTSTILQWYSNGTSTILHRYFHGTSLILPKYFVLQYFSDTSMVLQRYSTDTPMVLHQYFADTSMVLHRYFKVSEVSLFPPCGYYITAHASKFVRPNSIRIDSTIISGLPNVAFRRTDNNETVLIVLNEKETGKQAFQIECNGKIYSTSLNGGSVGTYIC